MKLRHILFMLLFLLTAKVKSQVSTYPIKGKVIDASTGLGIADATVRLIKQHVINKTGKDGLFNMLLNQDNDTLEVVALGYERIKIAVNRRTEFLNIPLAIQSMVLQEVLVNTGYQELKSNELTGSILKVDEKTLQQQVSTNILDRLNGVVSGLTFSKGKSNGNPQNKTHVVIRGLSTINGALDPLIVVDGFIYEGEIANINPENVESVSVLKDAAAASIWGARAGNGVVVINTKKGHLNQDMNISIHAGLTLSPKLDLMQIPQMSSSEYIGVEEMLFNKGYFNSKINSQPYFALTPAVSIFQKRKAGLITATDSTLMIEQLKTIDNRSAYLSDFYTAPIVQQYQMGINGGGQKNSYQFSVAYNNSLGNNTNHYDKLNIQAGQQFVLTEKLQANWGVYYSQSASKTGTLPYQEFHVNGRSAPYLQWRDQNGAGMSFPYLYSSSYTDTTGAGHLLDWNYYPLQEYLHRYTKTALNECYAQGGLKYQIVPFLNATLNYQYQNQNTESRNVADEQSYQSRNLINTYSMLNRKTGVVNYAIPKGGVLNVEDQKLSSYTGRFQLNLDKGWQKHRVNALAGAEMRQVQQSGQSNFYYGYQGDPLHYTQIDYVNRYRSWVTGRNETIGSSPKMNETNNRFVSYYANASYRYHERYTLYGSIRQDGSNIFGANTNDKWKPLWSVGAGWDISKENFYHISWLPYLKWSANWGYSGNVDLSRTALPVASYANNRLSQLPFVRITTINNPGLRWEESRQLNVKLDLAGKNKKWSGSLEYYNKKGTDLYGDSPFDYTAWGRSNRVIKNVASMKGNGIDLQLNARWLNKAVKWESSMIFNYNTTKVTAYYTDLSSQTGALLGGGSRITPVIGYPLYAIAAYSWGGLDNQGNPQGYIDGQKSVDYNALRLLVNSKGLDGGTMHYFGSADPQYFGSIINILAWKGFTLSLNVGYKFDYYLFRPSLSYSALVKNGRNQPEFSSRWQQQGDENLTNVPSFQYPVNENRDGFYNSSEVNVIKGDHIRLNYVNLGYDLKIRSGNKIFGGQLYLNLADAGIIWRVNQANVDPDYVLGYTPQATYSIGFRTNFK